MQELVMLQLLWQILNSITQLGLLDQEKKKVYDR